MIYRCDIYRRGASGVDDEIGAYPIEGDWASHLTGVFCSYSYDVRRTTGERDSETRASSTRYLTVYVPIDTDVKSADKITEIRDRLGNVVIYNDLDIVAAQPEHRRNQIRLVCEELR